MPLSPFFVFWRDPMDYSLSESLSHEGLLRWHLGGNGTARRRLGGHGP